MINTLIFDFGDVFLTLDKNASLRELQKFGVAEFSSEKIEFFELYEKGIVSTEVFIKKMREWFPHISEDQLVHAWNSILVGFPQNRMDFIKKLSKEGKFQLILLSNTNDLHIEWVTKNICFFEEFKACFDAFYLSHEINFRKPDHTIFEFVIEKHNLHPKEVLFIDDTEENTEAAERFGLHTWNICPAQEEVTDLFTHKTHLF